MSPDRFENLVRELVAHPTETEWLEFKLNYSEPERVGKNISALSNSAALHRKPTAYIVWGIEDGSHRIAGTDFSPHEVKIGNEGFEPWLARLLSPRIHMQIHRGSVENCHIVVFEIQPATNAPVRFKEFEYIRIGSNTTRLLDHPEKERALWRTFDEVPFEDGIASENVTSDEVLWLLDYPTYFRLLRLPLPDSRPRILESLCEDRIIARRSTERFDITNLGGVLFAHKLAAIPRLSRKSPRVVKYHGEDRTRTQKEQEGTRGYAVGFEGLIEYIHAQLPQNEEIGQALRTEVRMYPEIAVRELVANALIHQDFHVTGAGPTIEMFSDRMEITNPGTPLIEPDRFIDGPPRSRNEKLAKLMRRMSICEERGSGVDKAISAVETFQLPAPDFRVANSATIIVLFGPRTFAQMSREDRVRACYQHACLMYVSGTRMSNATLRKRLGIPESNYPMASRIIGDAKDAGLVRPYGNESSKRTASYIPFWA